MHDLMLLIINVWEKHNSDIVSQFVIKLKLACDMCITSGFVEFFITVPLRVSGSRKFIVHLFDRFLLHEINIERFL